MSTTTGVAPSELILNSDGSLYHIHLKPEHVADTVLLVGDQGRVELVSSFFDTIDFKIQNREFVTHTGTYKGKRLTVMSTGIGIDNVDIAINELDAAVNFNLETRTPKSEFKSLNLIRIGTSGALQEDVAVGSYLVSEFGLGLDAMLHYYKYPYNKIETELNIAFNKHLITESYVPKPYFTQGDSNLINLLSEKAATGITATATGFYGPQGRKLRLAPAVINLNEQLTSFRFKSYRVTNFEMETSVLYGLGNALGHKSCTICLIIANRINKTFIGDYKPYMKELVGYVLEKCLQIT